MTSTDSPLLARSLTYNVYARDVRRYKRRNLQAAATIIAAFAREHPDLFVVVELDADTYINPFFQGKALFDYNPGMLRQFREWLSGSGAYASAPKPGVPNVCSSRIHNGSPSREGGCKKNPVASITSARPSPSMSPTPSPCVKAP